MFILISYFVGKSHQREESLSEINALTKKAENDARNILGEAQRKLKELNKNIEAGKVSLRSHSVRSKQNGHMDN